MELAQKPSPKFFSIHTAIAVEIPFWLVYLMHKTLIPSSPLELPVTSLEVHADMDIFPEPYNVIIKKYDDCLIFNSSISI